MRMGELIIGTYQYLLLKHMLIWLLTVFSMPSYTNSTTASGSHQSVMTGTLLSRRTIVCIKFIPMYQSFF